MADARATWANYQAAQRARRHVRIPERLAALRDALPPGVTVRPIAHGPDVALDGYGLRVIYSPTHNHVSGLPERTAATPKQLADEYRWRWKREGCPRG